MAELIEFLRENAPREFKSEAYYSAEGNSLFYYCESPSSYYGQRIDDFLTVYRSNTPDRHLVGCQVKGIPAVLELFGSFGLDIADDHNQISLSMIFTVCLAKTDAPEDMKRFYVQLSERSKDTVIPKATLTHAA